jgi:hypothetical protein
LTYTVDYLGMDCKVGEIILYTQKEVVIWKKKLQCFFSFHILRGCLLQWTCLEFGSSKAFT